MHVNHVSSYASAKAPQTVIDQVLRGYTGIARKPRTRQKHAAGPIHIDHQPKAN